jgi:hypothetical protein
MARVSRAVAKGAGAHGSENPRWLLAAGLPARPATNSPRQLPTHHDYAVSTREYQSDQPSSNAVSASFAAAREAIPVTTKTRSRSQ